MQLTSEQIKKAKTAKSADELLAMANAEGVEITPEQAEIFFNTVSVDGELTDEQLLSVAGGSKGDDNVPAPEFPVGTPLYQGQNGIVFAFKVSAANYDSSQKCYFYDTVRRAIGVYRETAAHSHVTADFIRANYRMHECECF